MHVTDNELARPRGLIWVLITIVNLLVENFGFYSSSTNSSSTTDHDRILV